MFDQSASPGEMRSLSAAFFSTLSFFDVMPRDTCREFSRRYDLMQILPQSRAIQLESRPEERAALVRRFSLLALHSLTALVHLARVAGGVRLEAEYHCVGDQQCVVSLAPVPFTIAKQFRVDFDVEDADYRDDGPAAEDSTCRHSKSECEPASDFMDVFCNGVIDVGECIVQHFGSELDPYPRVPGAVIKNADLPLGVALGDESSPLSGESSHSPFQALAALKKGGS